MGQAQAQLGLIAGFSRNGRRPVLRRRRVEEALLVQLRKGSVCGGVEVRCRLFLMLKILNVLLR